jgi:gliding motility-associated-like protein
MKVIMCRYVRSILLWLVIFLVSSNGLYSFELDRSDFSIFSNEAGLSNLQLNEGRLEPRFNPDVTAYRVNLDFLTFQITLIPFAEDANSMIFINGKAVKSGSATGKIFLYPGENELSIEVQNPNGSAKVYRIFVSRNRPTGENYRTSNWDIPECDETSELFDEDACAAALRDDDGDGVPNYLDFCPGTPPGTVVDEFGCALEEADPENPNEDTVDEGSEEEGGSEGGDTGEDTNDQDGTDGGEDDGDTNDDEGNNDENGTDNGDNSDGDTGEDTDDQDGTDGGEDDEDNNDENGTGNGDNSDGDSSGEGDGNDGEDSGDGEDDNNESEPVDSDGDGVPDDMDQCPDTPEGEEVDENGCSRDQIDTDGDGVPDYLDLCPNTPENEEVDEYGCSLNEPEVTLVVDFTDFDMIEVPWGTPFDQTGLPTEIVVTTENGETFTFPIIWSEEGYDPYQSGPYILVGTIQLPNSWDAVFENLPSITVLVLPKDPPLDLILSNDFFNQNDSNTPILIGDFTVIDPMDDVHILELAPGIADNDLFVIIDGQLYWNNTEMIPGKNEFTIEVTVIDREGNVFTKEFIISRRLTDLLMEMNIPNTFTPDGDNINDDWGLPLLGIFKSVRLHIYERGGYRVFFTDDPSRRWDGTYQGKPLPIDTYYYVIEVDDDQASRKGILNLLRRQ